MKTCLDASQEAVKKSIINYGLHIQQYVYSELHTNIIGSPPADFVFVMVEKTAPFGVAVFRIDKEAIAAAKTQVKRGIEIYQECVRSNTWPCYPETVQNVNLPQWYYKQIEAAE